MAGLSEAGPIEDVFRDWVSDDGCRSTTHDVGDRAADRGNDCGCATRIGLARRGADGNAERHSRKGALKRCSRCRWFYHSERDIEPQNLGARGEELGVANNIEGGYIEFDPAPPYCERQIGSDARRLTERQRQRKIGGSAHLYSIIACLRISSRNFLDSISNFLLNSSCRVSRLAGESMLLCRFSHKANICRPWAVTSGWVR